MKNSNKKQIKTRKEKKKKNMKYTKCKLEIKENKKINIFAQISKVLFYQNINPNQIVPSPTTVPKTCLVIGVATKECVIKSSATTPKTC